MPLNREELNFTQPVKRCPNCGQEIPSDGFKPGAARLICEPCARAAGRPVPRKRQLRQGEAAEGQQVIDVPSIYIGDLICGGTI